ncbi:hypothetical protein Clacol_009702 [Clathrus columnatus]|uniref:GH16 domain-containing protein n=1 Tax=Clathrus columnatus TaxID=1419009 RepID=A0AAV5ARM6_9AGAM|nr:hypothetical protein Clacol_009702 [Clathrus columnatus]
MRTLGALTFALLFSLDVVHAQGPYQLIKTFQGETFFDDWTYFDGPDLLTNGDVVWVSKEVAIETNLTFVNNAGNAIIKVDNTSLVVFNQKRNSIRITTNDTYGAGSVWTADILHAPFGCSVWPAWWSQAPTSPIGGEIDTFENVNQATTNQISLHTTTGCNLAGSSFTGQTLSTNCSEANNGNMGCVIADNRTGAFGEAFANNGGGMFVTEYAINAINVWFFPRSNIPSVLNDSTTTLDTSNLGTPLAAYGDSAGCNITEFFAPQELIFDITLCGDFAMGVFNDTCSGSCSAVVIGPPPGYDNAFFEVKNVKVFQNAAAIAANPNAKSNSTQSPSPGSKSSAVSTSLVPLSGILFVGLLLQMYLVGSATAFLSEDGVELLVVPDLLSSMIVKEAYTRDSVKKYFSRIMAPSVKSRSCGDWQAVGNHHLIELTSAVVTILTHDILETLDKEITYIWKFALVVIIMLITTDIRVLLALSFIPWIGFEDYMDYTSSQFWNFVVPSNLATSGAQVLEVIYCVLWFVVLACTEYLFLMRGSPPSPDSSSQLVATFPLGKSNAGMIQGVFPKQSSVIAFGIPELIFQSILVLVIIMTIIRHRKTWILQEKTSLATIIIRDGLWGSRRAAQSALPSNFQTSRLLLNLRSSSGSGNIGVSDMTSLSFIRSRLSTDREMDSYSESQHQHTPEIA